MSGQEMDSGFWHLLSPSLYYYKMITHETKLSGPVNSVYFQLCIPDTWRFLRRANFKGCQIEVARPELFSASNIERKVQNTKAYCLKFEKHIGDLKHGVFM